MCCDSVEAPALLQTWILGPHGTWENFRRSKSTPYGPPTSIAGPEESQNLTELEDKLGKGCMKIENWYIGIRHYLRPVVGSRF